MNEGFLSDLKFLHLAFSFFRSSSYERRSLDLMSLKRRIKQHMLTMRGWAKHPVSTRKELMFLIETFVMELLNLTKDLVLRLR
ncbi:hypothetical protein HanXRQr2_Chr01g0020221 [Helianthus annuus]|nr:hypothetical protein HanXRQr2_Chr01g0020221 [Helianthus annuus]